MARSTHHHDYQALLDLLRTMRGKAGITQVELAARLENTQTFVSKYERGERRLDVIEFVEVCEALGLDPADAFGDLLHRRVPSKGGGRKVGKGR